MKRLLSYSVVMFVITIILLLIIPLPAGLVDVAIILNMSLSMMILVITMTIREPLEFSIFPSLLLITTLFRLGINVSTTRNILSQGGSSGRVIAAFGDFVLRGNVVVGLIIFLIIVLMQFIVITKGAERVAEVAARFNLELIFPLSSRSRTPKRCPILTAVMVAIFPWLLWNSSSAFKSMFARPSP